MSSVLALQQPRALTARLLLLVALAAGLLVVAGPTPQARAAVAPPPCDVAGNLVQNCGFETGDFAGWDVTTASSGSNVFVYGGLGHDGSQALVFGADQGEDDVVSRSIAGTTPGQTYVVQFWTRLDDTFETNHLSASVTGQDGPVTLYDRTNVASPFGMRLVTGSFVAGDTAPVVSFAGRSLGGWAVDDVSVAPAKADCAAVAGNLVHNCGFETGDYAGWTVLTEGASHTGVLDTSHFGTSAAYFASTDPVVDDQVVQPIIGTVEGATYLVQFWARNDDATNSNHLLVTLGSPNTGPVTVLEQTNADSYGWTLFTGSFVASSDTPTLSISARTPVAFWVDDFSVSPVPPTLTFTQTTLPDATGGSAYLQSLTTNGGNGPYTFAVTAGALPAGLVLDADGTLSGTPTEYGTAGFTITATDSNGYTGSQAYSLVVQTPTITMPGGPLPTPVYGTPYSQSVAASGGTAPYTYAVSSGTLPSGLTLDSATGVISGTPAAAEDASFMVTATDSGTGTGPATAGNLYSVTVAKASPILTITSPATGVVGESTAITASTPRPFTPVSYSTESGNCMVSGATVTFLAPGVCSIDAYQNGDVNNNLATASKDVTVAKAATTTTLQVQPHALVATVGVTAPGTGTATGAVAFQVDGTTVGSADLVDGVATLAYTVPAGLTRQVNAVYSGDASYLASSDSTARHDPTITAQVVTSVPRSASGWYRVPVVVRFTCTPHGAPLTGLCPPSVVLSGNGAGQSVSRTVTATDGGVATVSVTGLNIDRVDPGLRVAGIRSGAVYSRVPAARCVATDALSGVASCRLVRHTQGNLTRYVARAYDRAGNMAVVRGWYRVHRG